MKLQERLKRYELRKMCQLAKNLIKDTLLLVLIAYIGGVLIYAVHQVLTNNLT